MWFSPAQFRMIVWIKPVNQIHMFYHTGCLQQFCWPFWSVFSSVHAKQLEPAGESFSDKMCLCFSKAFGWKLKTFATLIYYFPVTIPKGITSLWIWNKNSWALCFHFHWRNVCKKSWSNSAQQLAKPSPGTTLVGFFNWLLLHAAARELFTSLHLWIKHVPQEIQLLCAVMLSSLPFFSSPPPKLSLHSCFLHFQARTSFVI